MVDVDYINGHTNGVVVSFVRTRISKALSHNQACNNTVQTQSLINVCQFLIVSILIN